MPRITDNISGFREKLNRLASGRIPFFFLIDFEMETPYVCTLSEAEDEGVIFNFNGCSSEEVRPGEKKADCRIVGKIPVSFECYDRAFTHVLNNLNAGNTYLANLTFPTEVRLDNNLESLYHGARAPYRLLFRDRFVMFSPETFVKIKDGYIYSHPMKGTIDGSVPDAEEVILNDQKEFWEHNTIVDLIRNDLSIVSSEVEVLRFRYIDRILTHEKELLQVSSEIRGRLPADWREHLGDIIVKLLPAGSISGAPKKKTVEVIREAEGGPRGYYTGISGFFDGESLDSAVNIRYIEKTPDGYFFRSGGGITSSSDVQSEYRELLDKVNVPSDS